MLLGSIIDQRRHVKLADQAPDIQLQGFEG